MCKDNFAIRYLFDFLVKYNFDCFKDLKISARDVIATAPHDLKKRRPQLGNNVKVSFHSFTYQKIQYSSAYVMQGKWLDKQERLQSTEVFSKTRIILNLTNKELIKQIII